jgi:hypothetical protein
MKFIKFLVFMIYFATANAAETLEPGRLGAGLMIGSMISVTGKYWLGDGKSALDFGLGFGSSDGISIYGDYLWHVPRIFGTSTQFGRQTSGYIGGGPGIGFWSDSYNCGHWRCDRRTTSSGSGFFLRALAGFEWFPKPTRFGVFAELGPTFLLTPTTSGSLDIGIGGRYYF